MNLHKRKPGYKYRLCRKCGKDWNVSANTNDQKYTCPKCAGKKEKNK